MAAGPIAERNQDATIYVGGLDDKVSETLLWELFLEAGPVGTWVVAQISSFLDKGSEVNKRYKTCH